MSHPILSCLVLSCHVLSYSVISFPTLSCHILSYSIRSCPILSYHILSSSLVHLVYYVLLCTVLDYLVALIFYCSDSPSVLCNPNPAVCFSTPLHITKSHLTLILVHLSLSLPLPLPRPLYLPLLRSIEDLFGTLFRRLPDVSKYSFREESGAGEGKSCL